VIGDVFGLPRRAMRNNNWRSAFASFLERMAVGAEQPHDWYDHVVLHYPDEVLEEIRRELVRLSIARNPNGHPVWIAADREQFRTWARELRKPGANPTERNT
jgi:hypothetical protein